MLNSLINNEIVVFLRRSLFVKVAIAVGLLLTVTLGVQAYIALTAEDTATRSDEASSIRVHVGEMYFTQADSDLPENVLEANVGDTIEFYNEGNLRHSVTIDELDFDEVLFPGDSTFLTLEQTVTEALVNCKFHPGHDATLTVGDGEPAEYGHAMEAPAVDTSTLPTRSHADSIEQLPFEIVDGVKEFHLSAEHVMWEYADGYTLEAWAFNGQVPGPEIRMTEGEQVRVIFENKLPVATTVHWHGVDVPNEADGVPHVTQDAVEPGETFVYEFTADPAGTRYYHAHGSHHGDEQLQVDMGLSGPIVIEPINYQAPDREYTMVLGERVDAGVYPINGKVYPNPEQFVVAEGDRVRIRMIHAGSAEIHPMHLHGHQFEVVAIDGNPVPVGSRQLRNTQPMMPGEIYDIEFTANNPGAWVFHCHHLGHAAGGMIAEVIYE
jgi:FtsP/CotA-like multicopper oxidase with cupredoxin domain